MNYDLVRKEIRHDIVVVNRARKKEQGFEIDFLGRNTEAQNKVYTSIRKSSLMNRG